MRLGLWLVGLAVMVAGLHVAAWWAWPLGAVIFVAGFGVGAIRPG